MEGEETYTYPEAAERLRIGVQSLKRLVSLGRIGHFRVGPGGVSVRFAARHLADYLRSCEVEPRGTARPARREAIPDLIGEWRRRRGAR